MMRGDITRHETTALLSDKPHLVGNREAEGALVQNKFVFQLPFLQALLVTDLGSSQTLTHQPQYQSSNRSLKPSLLEVEMIIRVSLTILQHKNFVVIGGVQQAGRNAQSEQRLWLPEDW